MTILPKMKLKLDSSVHGWFKKRKKRRKDNISRKCMVSIVVNQVDIMLISIKMWEVYLMEIVPILCRMRMIFQILLIRMIKINKKDFKVLFY